jgi:hypothetical protein
MRSPLNDTLIGTIAEYFDDQRVECEIWHLPNGGYEARFESGLTFRLSKPLSVPRYLAEHGIQVPAYD